MEEENHKILVIILVLFVAVVLFNLVFFLISDPSIVGFVTKPMTMVVQGNIPPVITVEDFSVYEGEYINISDCGYDPNGDNFTCYFSPPINSSGEWQTSEGDAGVYVVEINATDIWNMTSYKNITLTVLLSTCWINATRNADNSSIITLDWRWTSKNLSNYTLYWKDGFLENGMFNISDAYNISLYNTTLYNDTNATAVKQRYYRIRGYNSSVSLLCNSTAGKYDWEFVTNNGRWNFFSMPFYQSNYGVEEVLAPGVADLEFIFWYNHSTGGWNVWNFDFHIGNLQHIYPGESYMVQPSNSYINVTTAGQIFHTIEENITTSFGRWNFVGWVAEKTPRDEAEQSIVDDYEWMFWYNSTSGGYLVYNNEFKLGALIELLAGESYWVQPDDNVIWYYNMLNTT